MRLAHQRQRRQSLQQRRRGVAGRHPRGDFDRLGGGHGRVLGVGGGGEPDDAVADAEVVRGAGPGGQDVAFGFAAEGAGEGGRV